MPTTTADIYSPNLDGSDLEWAVSESGASIYNPTPWTYATNDIVYVKQAGTYWVIDRAYEWLPCFSTAFDGTATDGAYVTLDSSPYTKGAVASQSGQTITISAPIATGRYRFEVAVDCHLFGTSGSGGSITATLTLEKNGAGISGWTDVKTAAGLAHTKSLTRKGLARGSFRSSRSGGDAWRRFACHGLV